MTCCFFRWQTISFNWRAFLGCIYLIIFFFFGIRALWNSVLFRQIFSCRNPFFLRQTTNDIIFSLVTWLEVNTSINMINTTVVITAFIVLCIASIHIRNEIHFEELDVKLSYKINRVWFGMAIFWTVRIRYLISRNTGYNVFVYLLGQSKWNHLL